MVKTSVLVVVLAWICLIHSCEAAPLRSAESATLDSGVTAQDLQAVAEAEREVDAVHIQTPAGSNELRESGATQPKTLQPGQKGYLEQQIEGKPTTFKDTMKKIDQKLKDEQLRKRERSYEQEQLAGLANNAANAVGKMAQVIGSEAEADAEHKAAEAADCAVELQAETDPEKKKVLAKECAEKLDAKNKAYAAAAEAAAASGKAVTIAGARAGQYQGNAAMNRDFDGQLTQAQNDAAAAKAKLKNYEAQTAVDRRLRVAQADVARRSSREMARAEAAEERVDDRIQRSQISSP